MIRVDGTRCYGPEIAENLARTRCFITQFQRLSAMALARVNPNHTFATLISIIKRVHHGT